MLIPGVIASAPVDGLVDVTISTFDAEQVFNGCQLVGLTPVVGDDCLVVIDESGKAWAAVPGDASPALDARLDVVEGRSLVYLTDYGAVYDGSGASAAANNAAMAAAFAALPAQGGVIVHPRGTGVYSVPWPSHAGRRGITHRGEAGGPHPLGFGTGTTIVFTCAGTTPCIDITSSASMLFEGLDLRYNNPLFTGWFIDMRGITGDAHDINFERCNLGDNPAYTVNSAAGILRTDKSNSILLDHCWLWGAAVLIRGREAQYVVNFKMFGGGLINSTDVHILDGGESWGFYNVAIEQRLDGKAAFYRDSVGSSSSGMLLSDCWAGDFFTSGGNLIEWRGAGLKIIGGIYKFQLADGTLVKIVGNNTRDVEIDTYALGAGVASVVLDFGVTTGHNRIHIGGYLSNITATTGTIPPDFSMREATGLSMNSGLSIGGAAPAPVAGGIQIDRTGGDAFIRIRRNNTPGAQIRTTGADTASGLLLANDTGAGGAFLDMIEMAAPAAPGANKARLFTRDNGAGKTQVCVQFPTGAVQVIATEP